jgi:O-acetyl-ADP-ribose deacetylase
MNWYVHVGDLLDVRAEVLICSGNVWLNLSGGVGGALLGRYGDAMQTALHKHLQDRDVRHVPPGTVVAVPSLGTPYRQVLHAVAVDAFYESSVERVTQLYDECLRQAAAGGARTVAAAALACGYGHMSAADFARALAPIVGREYPPIETVVVGFRSPHDAADLKLAVPEMGTCPPELVQPAPPTSRP